MKTQKAIILEHLERYEFINDLICFQEYYITDLQHYIYELRKEGYKITDKWIKKTNSKGRKIQYKEYRLERCKDGTMETSC